MMKIRYLGIYVLFCISLCQIATNPIAFAGGGNKNKAAQKRPRQEESAPSTSETSASTHSASSASSSSGKNERTKRTKETLTSTESDGETTDSDTEEDINRRQNAMAIVPPSSLAQGPTNNPNTSSSSSSSSGQYISIQNLLLPALQKAQRFQHLNTQMAQPNQAITSSRSGSIPPAPSVISIYPAPLPLPPFLLSGSAANPPIQNLGLYPVPNSASTSASASTSSSLGAPAASNSAQPVANFTAQYLLSHPRFDADMKAQLVEFADNIYPLDRLFFQYLDNRNQVLHSLKERGILSQTQYNELSTVCCVKHGHKKLQQALELLQPHFDADMKAKGVELLNAQCWEVSRQYENKRIKFLASLKERGILSQTQYDKFIKYIPSTNARPAFETTLLQAYEYLVLRSTIRPASITVPSAPSSAPAAAHSAVASCPNSQATQSSLPLPSSSLTGINMHLTILAAAQGHPMCQRLLGEAYLTGTNGFPKNRLLAFEHLKIAAASGSTQAKYFLGELYRQGGEGIPKDATAAYENYVIAKNRGHSLATQRVTEFIETYKDGKRIVIDAGGMDANARAHFRTYLANSHIVSQPAAAPEPS